MALDTTACSLKNKSPVGVKSSTSLDDADDDLCRASCGRFVGSGVRRGRLVGSGVRRGRLVGSLVRRGRFVGSGAVLDRGFVYSTFSGARTDGARLTGTVGINNVGAGVVPGAAVVGMIGAGVVGIATGAGVVGITTGAGVVGVATGAIGAGVVGVATGAATGALVAGAIGAAVLGGNADVQPHVDWNVVLAIKYAHSSAVNATSKPTEKISPHENIVPTGKSGLFGIIVPKSTSTFGLVITAFGSLLQTLQVTNTRSSRGASS